MAVELLLPQAVPSMASAASKIVKRFIVGFLDEGYRVSRGTDNRCRVLCPQIQPLAHRAADLPIAGFVQVIKRRRRGSDIARKHEKVGSFRRGQDSDTRSPGAARAQVSDGDSGAG